MKTIGTDTGGSELLKRDMTNREGRIKSLEEELDKCRKLSLTDPLTGLGNYRHFRETLETEIKRCMRYDLPFSLALFDVDHFKQLNSGIGYEGADEILKNFADYLLENTRKPDMPFRRSGEYGDEFVLIMPATPYDRSIVGVKRLLTGYDKNTIPVTFSAGINTYINYDGKKFFEEEKFQEFVKDFLRQTDSALNRAKSEGRNRICHTRGDVVLL